MPQTSKCKYPPAHALRKWLEAAPPEAKRLLAELGNASKDMRQQWVTGRRALSAAKAGDLEAAMIEISSVCIDAPAPLYRGDLCATCAKCSYYLKDKNEI